jgi:hypothetical protein
MEYSGKFKRFISIAIDGLTTPMLRWPQKTAVWPPWR